MFNLFLTTGVENFCVVSRCSCASQGPSSRALSLPVLQPQDQSREADTDPKADHAEEGSPEGLVCGSRKFLPISQLLLVAHLKPIITGHRQLTQLNPQHLCSRRALLAPGPQL